MAYKALLFLYPIKEYFESSIQLSRNPDCQPNRLNQIIEKRYREKGFRIFWVMFANPSDLEKPDLTRISKHIRPAKQDKFLSSGVTFENHVNNKKYPNPKFIFVQLPIGIKEVVVGGFHQGDCVDKIARAAYRIGVPTFVEEDITEMFFLNNRPGRRIPIIRKTHRLLEEDYNPEIIRMARMLRKNKPWFFLPPVSGKRIKLRRSRVLTPLEVAAPAVQRTNLSKRD